MNIVPENINYFIRELEMETQLKLAQKDQDSASADAQSDMVEDAPAEERTSASGLILTVQRTSEEVLTAEAQKSRLAKAGAVYCAIAEISEPTDSQEKSVSCRA